METFNIGIKYPECIALRLIAQSELTRRLDVWESLDWSDRLDYFFEELLPLIEE